MNINYKKQSLLWGLLILITYFSYAQSNDSNTREFGYSTTSTFRNQTKNLIQNINTDFIIDYNKFSKQLKLINNTNTKQYQALLVNLTGAILYNKTLKSLREIIDISELSTGIYILKIGDFKIQKIIID